MHCILCHATTPRTDEEDNAHTVPRRMFLFLGTTISLIRIVPIDENIAPCELQSCEESRQQDLFKAALLGIWSQTTGHISCCFTLR